MRPIVHGLSIDPIISRACEAVALALEVETEQPLERRERLAQTGRLDEAPATGLRVSATIMTRRPSLVAKSRPNAP